MGRRRCEHLPALRYRLSVVGFSRLARYSLGYLILTEYLVEADTGRWAAESVSAFALSSRVSKCGNG